MLRRSLNAKKITITMKMEGKIDKKFNSDKLEIFSISEYFNLTKPKLVTA